jgi:prepilin-type N-terminal cleavage/methylation domain-containing protein
VGADRGFTLIEVVVVMAVLSFGILGVLQATLLAARLEQRGQAITTGTFLAQESLERIGALGWDRVAAELTPAALPASIGAEGTWLQQEVVRSEGRFLLVYEREPPPEAAPRCTVRCYWDVACGGYAPKRVVSLSVRRRR